ncbi:MAG: hypothetical protein HOP10_11735 [Chitinophagaceae bacterium]|nr:hypothetical protein [Chitinophagaceae bacterium]
MKKLLFAVLSFATISVNAQTADEVIQKYTNNLGGLDAFTKITSAKITGTYSTQGQDLPLTIQIINGKGVRSDVEAMGMMVTNVYFNGKGWKINPFAGATTPTEVTGNELNDIKAQASLANQLMDYKARAHQVEMQDKETVEGIETYKIKLTAKEDGRVTTYYISTKDYTLIKSATAREIQGQEMDVESFYSDLKEFGGVKFFMMRDSKIEGQVFQTVKYEKIELNVTIDEKIFEMK